MHSGVGDGVGAGVGVGFESLLGSGEGVEPFSAGEEDGVGVGRGVGVGVTLAGAGDCTKGPLGIGRAVGEGLIFFSLPSSGMSSAGSISNSLVSIGTMKSRYLPRTDSPNSIRYLSPGTMPRSASITFGMASTLVQPCSSTMTVIDSKW